LAASSSRHSITQIDTDIDSVGGVSCQLSDLELTAARRVISSLKDSYRPNHQGQCASDLYSVLGEMLGDDLAKIAADFEMEIEEPQASIELVNAEADLGGRGVPYCLQAGESSVIGPRVVPDR